MAPVGGVSCCPRGRGRRPGDEGRVLPPSLPPAPGTRIIYDRKFLLDRRNSPMAQTPPCHLPDIPGVTSPSAADEPKAEAGSSLSNHDGKPSTGDDAQFEMDI
nr:eukaryotic translation initiation factor 4E-binding protein 2 [Anser cygnoides]